MQFSLGPQVASTEIASLTETGERPTRSFRAHDASRPPPSVPAERMSPPAPLGSMARLAQARAACRLLHERGLSALADVAEALGEIFEAQVVAVAGTAAGGFDTVIPANLGQSEWVSLLDSHLTKWRTRPASGFGTADVAGLPERGVSHWVAVPIDDAPPELTDGAGSVEPSGALLLGWNHAGGATDDDLLCFSMLGEDLARALWTARRKRPSDGPPGSVSDQFLSFVAHELRTPLTPLTMLLQTLERKARAGSMDLESIARARRQVLRLTKLIGEVMDLSRLNAGQLAPEVAPFDLAELLADVAGTFRSTTHKHGLTLTIHSAPLRVNGDRLRLERAMLSLLELTERSSPAGSTLEVDAESSNGRVRICVAETGGPLVPEQRQWVTGHEPKDGFNTSLLRGLNLGLYVAKGVMARHGGTLTIEEIPGPGLRSVLSLPLSPG